ncbi:MAG TPA: AMP-binding protein [Chitinispirillaceae bacterium]|nr:AMP-binding protein [Chitinispirillaceae bacterium]
MAFKPEYSWEFLSADEITAKSLRALRNHVTHAREASPFYREAYAGIEPGDIKSIDDFQKIPFTNKDHIAHHWQHFKAVADEKIVETVVTSGSTGVPVPFSLTTNDLERLAFNEALSFNSVGIKKGDLVHILVSLDRLFIAGMAYYRGLSLLGANTMRIGVLPVEMQKYYLDFFKPVTLVGVPSFLKKLAKELNDLKFDTRACSVKKLVCIGESLKTSSMEANSMTLALEQLWDAEVYSSYASTELSVSYCDCQARAGGHAHPELVYTEIVDEKGVVVPDGTPGELVATPLGVEGVPLVRFKTGDITFKISQPCSCGRNSLRIGPILGRKSQMIKLKGTTVYPLSITNVLDSIDTIKDYIIILENDDALSDRVSIHVAAAPSSVEQIANQLRAVTRVNFPILVSNVNTIQSFRGESRKKIRVADWRKSLAVKA